VRAVPMHYPRITASQTGARWPTMPPCSPHTHSPVAATKMSLPKQRHGPPAAAVQRRTSALLPPPLFPAFSRQSCPNAWRSKTLTLSLSQSSGREIYESVTGPSHAAAVRPPPLAHNSTPNAEEVPGDLWRRCCAAPAQRPAGRWLSRDPLNTPHHRGMLRPQGNDSRFRAQSGIFFWCEPWVCVNALSEFLD